MQLAEAVPGLKFGRLGSHNKCGCPAPQFLAFFVENRERKDKLCSIRRESILKWVEHCPLTVSFLVLVSIGTMNLSVKRAGQSMYTMQRPGCNLKYPSLESETRVEVFLSARTNNIRAAIGGGVIIGAHWNIGGGGTIGGGQATRAVQPHGALQKRPWQYGILRLQCGCGDKECYS